MHMLQHRLISLSSVVGTGALVSLLLAGRAEAQDPTMLVPELTVAPVVAGLTTPIGIAFLGEHDMLVIEKNTGQVKRVVDGSVRSIVLDLAVNNASERGLLSIALHPKFPQVPWVYLYWSCRAPAPVDPFRPSQRGCDPNTFLGADTAGILEVPLLGNRLDRFRWNGVSLTFDRALIQMRAFQNDGGPEPPDQGDLGQPARGNHNGGVVRFGPDGKLYLQVGDTGRRGQLQNLPCGPTANCPGPVVPDDQFGGPQPDNAHLTGVILRLNDDGTTPDDNPFFAAGAAVGGQVGANIQKIFAYGLRNGFGLAFDHLSGNLWEQENGDDSFSELNRIEPGMNSGWVQTMGPVDRIAEFKAIETTPPFVGLQQLRWPPTNIASSPDEALSRLFVLPGSSYRAPELTWKYEVAPGGIGFVRGDGLGAKYAGDLFMGAAAPGLQGGHLFRFKLSEDRKRIAMDDPRLEDKVADNVAKYDVTESEGLIVGRDFGVSTDVQTGPNGHLFVVSLSKGTIYEIALGK
jgi:glucose/arabinose dehydrogenase